MRMQVKRTRRRIKNLGGSCFSTQSNPRYSSTWYRPIYSYDIEYMEDVVGAPQAYNPLLHIKYEVVPHRFIGQYVQSGTTYTRFGNAEIRASNDINFNAPPSLSITENDMKRALDQFEQQVDGRSVLTDFAEALELKSLFKDLPNMVDSVKQILGAKAFSKPLSSLTLTSELAIRPTLKMFSDYAAAVKGFDKKLKWIRKNQGKEIIQTVQGIPAETFVGTFAPIQAPSTPWSVGYSGRREIRRSNVTFRGHMLPMTDFESVYSLTANSFKLDTPLSTAWAVVPLSFVVDWFYKVGEKLEDLENSGIPMVTGATLLGVSHHLEITRYANMTYPGFGSQTTPAAFSVPVSSKLQRRVNIPNVVGSSLVGSGLSSSWRQMISAALIRARF